MKIAALLLLGGCATGAPPDLDPGLSHLALSAVHPALLLPKTPMTLEGTSFVDEQEGLSWLRLAGTWAPSGGAFRAVDVQLPGRFIDATHLEISEGLWEAFGAEAGSFDGSATLSVDSAVDQTRHTARPLSLSLQLARTLLPVLTEVTQGPIFVNSPVSATGEGFLLGGAEGETRAVLDGCFLPAGQKGPCKTTGMMVGTVVSGLEVPLHPSSPWDRNHAQFPFAPEIAGIHPGSFTGTVSLKNRVAERAPTLSTSLPLVVTLQHPTITKVSPLLGSLGQYIDITGGGFTGGSPGSVTLFRLVGNFTVEGGGSQPVDLYLLPRYVDGGHLRYVIDETDQLGKRVNLRTIAGSFHGTAQPVVLASGALEIGTQTTVDLGLGHVKQVVFLHFDASYAKSLRRFGLQAADEAVRSRVLAVAQRDYTGTNVEFRLDPPNDFALFEQVDILGPDPNGLGLLGYDNTPGKDIGNTRLFDRIGGVNATTQLDGYPGYGGVFAENFLGFSMHPPSDVAGLPLADSTFDEIFDPLRIDRSGQAATLTEVDGLAARDSGDGCPASDRRTQVACAVFVFGNLIGTTLTHETGHSLGLANPNGDGFHNPGNQPNRLMDSGENRPFAERAQLQGAGPARFCSEEVTYLKQILPANGPNDPHPRPPCN